MAETVRRDQCRHGIERDLLDSSLGGLEAAGFEVKLINAREAKNLPGRKSDVLDCQWIQQLHSYGLRNASFRPPEQIVALRSLVRHRDRLIAARAVHIQHMQKALHLMNLQLDNVLG